jgi:hypothetical protein
MIIRFAMMASRRGAPRRPSLDLPIRTSGVDGGPKFGQAITIE